MAVEAGPRSWAAARARSDRAADHAAQRARRDAARRARFAAIEAIRAKNADLDPEMVEDDIAAEIAAMRAKRFSAL